MYSQVYEVNWKEWLILNWLLQRPLLYSKSTLENLFLPTGRDASTRLNNVILRSGNIYWKVDTPLCSAESDKVAVYKGLGELVWLASTTKQLSLYVQVKHNGYYFQMKLENVGKMTVCGLKTSATEHADLFVAIISPTWQSTLSPGKTGGWTECWSHELNSKVVYTMRHPKEQVDNLFDLCFTRRDVACRIESLKTCKPLLRHLPESLPISTSGGLVTQQYQGVKLYMQLSVRQWLWHQCRSGIQGDTRNSLCRTTT